MLKVGDIVEFKEEFLEYHTKKFEGRTEGRLYCTYFGNLEITNINRERSYIVIHFLDENNNVGKICVNPINWYFAGWGVPFNPVKHTRKQHHNSKCPRCGSPAYTGFFQVECNNCGG